MMTFFINGCETAVVVDDFVPIRGRSPAFGYTKESEFWAILMEKAWAKLHGTYARIEAGLPGFACMHLLGTPTMSFHSSEIKENKDAFWVKLRSWD